MIEGHIQHGHEMEALELFEKMQQECVKPDEFTFSCILNACGTSGSIEKGEEIQFSCPIQQYLYAQITSGLRHLQTWHLEMTSSLTNLQTYVILVSRREERT